MTKAIMKFMIIEVYFSICPLMIQVSFRGGIDLEPREINRWESTRDILVATYDSRNYVPTYGS